MDEANENLTFAAPALLTDAIPSQVIVELCEKLRELAYQRARRLGFQRQDAEDCASGFWAHMLKNNLALILLHLHDPSLNAWFSRCADNWTLNYYRQYRRRCTVEISSCQTGKNHADVYLRAYEAAAPGSYANLLAAELNRRIISAVLRLPASQQDLFVRHYLQAESIADLARTSQRTANAVRQALWATRHHLRLLLARQGFDEAEANDYLLELSSRHRSRYVPRRSHWIV